jgi:two-component system, LuxR family, response regulator FixJ
MPGMNGLELQQMLKSMGSTIPVIVVTSSTDLLIRSCALEGGAIAYLSKPVKDEVLICHLKTALGRGYLVGQMDNDHDL